MHLDADLTRILRPWFSVVDVGASKDATGIRIRGELTTLF